MMFVGGTNFMVGEMLTGGKSGVTTCVEEFMSSTDQSEKKLHQLG